MKPIVTAFENSPDKGRGLARDMRVRWALEEVGQTYDVRLVTFAELKTPAYRALNPFGQIPAYQEGDLVLFESAAIVLHIAETHLGLLPPEPNARSRAKAWMFCALSTVELPIHDRANVTLHERDRDWSKDRLPLVEDRIRARLHDLSSKLGASPWLDGDFSAGDLLMVTVLRRLCGSGLLEAHPNLCQYLARAEGRPAFQRAFAAQLKVYQAASTRRR